MPRSQPRPSPDPLPACPQPHPLPPYLGTRPLPYATVALVLQGGGALGAYQAGVYQGLHEAGILPNWIAGISIGALNTAVIAGNAPEHRVERLREFWQTICRPALLQPSSEALQAWVERLGGPARQLFNAFEAWRALTEGQQGFFVPRLPPPWMALQQPPTLVSFYDTALLKGTLERLADFDRINAGEVRVSVGVVELESGNFDYFDNTRHTLRPEHFMASGALPPGFPPVEIDGKLYWDGGLVSNTPLTEVVAAEPRRDTLAFQVDLWSAHGHAPGNLFDVYERAKDIQYSSRTRAVTNQLQREQAYRRLLRELLEQVPAEARERDPWCRRAMTLACEHRYNIVHLIYQDKEWDGASKDYEFGPLTMRNHWDSGLADIRHTLAHPEWLELPDNVNGFVTHDVHRLRQAAIDRELQTELGPLPRHATAGAAPASDGHAGAHAAQAPAARPHPAGRGRDTGSRPPGAADSPSPEPAAVKRPGSAPPASPKASRPRG